MNEICKARNGGYVCQFELTGERHTGMHYAYYTSADGRARIAYWVDQYGKLWAMKAPVPTIKRTGGS